MPNRTYGAIAALVLAFATAASVPAIAQTPPSAQSDQDHKGHHPDGKAPGTQAAPAQPSPPSGGQSGMMGKGGGMMGGGMMCGEMKQMMSMMQDMHAMMSAHAGMMESRVEANIAKLKADLKVTDAQAAQWNRFADALRASAKSMDSSHQHMMKPAAGSLPERVAHQEQRMSAHLKSVQAIREALTPFYAVLSAEQKKIADGIRIGPMGMM